MYIEKNTANANAFKKMRLKRGHTQASLAAASGVAKRVIQYIDQNGIESTSCGTAYKLARTLRCAVEDLIDEEDTPD